MGRFVLPCMLGICICTALGMEPPPDKPGEQALTDLEAGTEVKPTRLPGVVVTATRTEKLIQDVPATVYRLDLEELQDERLVRTLPESLREVPGVLVQKTGHAQGSPFLRGFTSFRNVLLVDGIRLNNSVFRDGPNQYWASVDPYSLESLEIQMGTASVLYGSDAIGGAVQAFSESGFEPGDEAEWRGRLYDRVSTAENSNIARAELDAAANSTALHLGFSWKDFGNLETGAATLPRTGYDEWDLDAKITHWLDPESRLVLGYQRVDQDDAWRVHRTVHAVPFDGTEVGDELSRVLDQNRDLVYAQFHATERGGMVEGIHASLSWQLQAEERLRQRTRQRKDVQGFDVETLGITLQLESPTPIGDFTYGIDYYRDAVDSFRRDRRGTDQPIHSIQGPVADDATYDLFGAYVQNDIPILEIADLIVGARFTHADVDAKKVQDPVTGEQISIRDDWQNLVGSGRLLIGLDRILLGEGHDEWNLFGGISQGFRAPNLSDLTRLDTARSGEIEIPSTGLDPERFVSYEAGLKADLDWWQLQTTYFYTVIEDQIVRAPTGMVIDDDLAVEKRNAGDGFVEGIELETRFFIGDFTLRGGFAWLDGEVDAFPTSEPVLDREPLSRLLPTWGLLSLRYDHPEGSFWGEAVLSLVDEQDDLSSGDRRDTQRIPPGGTPGYEFFVLRGGVHVTDGLDFSASLENVFDQDYRVHGSGLNEPGINLIMGLDWRFGGKAKKR